ncbi:MAG: PrgI family protein [Microbacterium sp.]|uniref:PrgI family protein n=1 Tax=Microbacterium sp. TaxID=51671 RepID=UPI003F9A5485
MALEMKVHRDVAAYQARPMFGMTWRQILALAIMIFFGGGMFFLTASIYLILHDASWTDSEQFGPATNLALFVVFPFLVPVAWWAWMRPKGLKPETYAQYFIRYQIADKVISYADSYTDPAAREPVSDGSSRRDAAEARKVEAAIARSISEHPQDPAARRARKQAARRARHGAR